MSTEQAKAREDLREGWSLKSRPEWLKQFNELGPKMNIKSIIPLTVESLTQEAMQNTGLSDFGDDGWDKHFAVLMKYIEEEAKLNFFGRILTRSDMLNYLEARLRVIDTYKKHPEIENEVVKEPVFILGLGRSGTTILQESLAQDPQFRSVRRWEGMFPVPPPEEATYETDPRIKVAAGFVDVVHTVSPAWKTMHAWGSEIPVEDIEFTYMAFFSEIWGTAYQVPSYEKYFASQDPAYHFYWHKKLLKLLQWKYKKKHWLLKNPTHMPRIPDLLKAYPDAKIIFPHRDPIASADSVVNVMGTVFSWRTDNPYHDGASEEWLVTDWRVRMWDNVIGWIADGTLRKGQYTNFLYSDFMKNPGQALTKLYSEIGLTLDPAVLTKITKFIEGRAQSDHGTTHSYDKTAADDPAVAEERKIYQRYQSYFNVPNER